MGISHIECVDKKYQILRKITQKQITLVFDYLLRKIIKF